MQAASGKSKSILSLAGASEKQIEKHRDNKLNPRTLGIIAIICFLPLGFTTLFGWHTPSLIEMTMTGNAASSRTPRTASSTPTGTISEHRLVDMRAPSATATASPTATQTASATATRTETPKPSETATPAPTGTFAANIWVSTQTRWSDAGSAILNDSGMDYRKMGGRAALCPRSMELGSEIRTESGRSYVCGGYTAAKECEGKICFLVVFTRESIPQSERAAVTGNQPKR